MTEGTGTSADGVTEEVARRLRAVGRAVSPEEIGDLWIFPPLEDVEHSAEFLLFTRRLEEGKLRLYSARLRHAAAGEDPEPAAANGNGHANGNGRADGNGNGAHAPNGGPPMRQEITEHGSVPADRLPGFVVRLQRRLGGAAEPRHVAIDGRPDRWHELLPARANGASNGAGRVEASNGRP